MKRIAFTTPLAALVLSTGCAIHPEGTSIKTQVDLEDWRNSEAAWKANSGFDEAQLADEANRERVGVIAIGRVGPLRSFSEDDEFEDFYEEYVDDLARIGTSHLIMSREELRTHYGGWTSVTVSGVPQLMFRMAFALVEADLLADVDFSSVAGTFFLGAREDLVAARGGLDQPFLAVEALLCKEDSDAYSRCMTFYRKGLYDAVTERELGREFKVKDEGRVIDVETFRVLVD